MHLKSKLLTFPDGRFTHATRTSGPGTRSTPCTGAPPSRPASGSTHRVARREASGRGGGGDLNDEPQAATTQILLGPPGSEVGTGGFDQPDAGDAQRLWNTAGFIDPEQRWSRVYRGREELIDHVLVSDALRGLKGHGGLSRADPKPASVNDNPTERIDKPGSDHRPVMATLAS